MAKRYYICRVLGDGTMFTNPFRSELNFYIRENWPNEPHFIKQAIHPRALMWVISKYDLSSACHTDVMATISQIVSFPPGLLDRTWSSLTQQQRDNIRSKIEQMGFVMTWADSNTTIREVLRYMVLSMQVASWADVSISGGNFDLFKRVADIPQAGRRRLIGKYADLGIDGSWITPQTTIAEIAQRVQFEIDGITPRLFGKKKRRQWFYHDEDTE